MKELCWVEEARFKKHIYSIITFIWYPEKDWKLIGGWQGLVWKDGIDYKEARGISMGDEDVPYLGGNVLYLSKLRNCIRLAKFIELYTQKGWIVLYVNYILINQTLKTTQNRMKPRAKEEREGRRKEKRERRRGGYSAEQAWSLETEKNLQTPISARS